MTSVVQFSQNVNSKKQHFLKYLKRQFWRDRAIINRYFCQREVKKLHIGCGWYTLKGWLNSDLEPCSNNIIYLDAREPFPFPDESFHFIFSEHMIEHISYTEGLRMLNECCRVLKNKGKIRISTPDLAFLIELYRLDKSELQSEYIRWATDSFIKSAPYYDDTFVINNFVRDWGHLFIYDEKTLRSSLEKAGFTSVTRWLLNKSDDDSLQNLENEERMPGGFLQLETLSLEGTKVRDI